MVTKKESKPKEVKAKETKPKKKIGVLSGVVTSDKMDKTIVVTVSRLKKHSKYLKRYSTSKKYKVHDSENKFKIGDKVSFVSCRPISKDKKWKVLYN